MVHCLRTWRHYLLGSRFVVKTENMALSYFQTQKKLSPKQARWQDFLVEYDYVLEYKPGKTNTVADALSQKVELAAISKPEGSRVEKIKEGKTRRFWIEWDLLHTKGNPLYVSLHEKLRKDVLHECHDSKWQVIQGCIAPWHLWRSIITGHI